MAETTLHELLGIPKERAEQIAKSVRTAYSESSSAAEWVQRLVAEFGIEPRNAEIFACGWFAGRYAGVSEVFKIVSVKMDEIEKDRLEKAEKESRYRPPDGYV